MAGDFEWWSPDMMWRSPVDDPKDAYAFDIEFEHDSTLWTVGQGYEGQYWYEALSSTQSRWPLQRGLGSRVMH